MAEVTQPTREELGFGPRTQVLTHEALSAVGPHGPSLKVRAVLRRARRSSAARPVIHLALAPVGLGSLWPDHLCSTSSLQWVDDLRGVERRGDPQRHLHGGLPLPQLSYLPSPADLVSIYTPAWLPQQPRLPYFRSPEMRKEMEAGWFPLRLGGFHGNTTSPCSPEGS